MTIKSIEGAEINDGLPGKLFSISVGRFAKNKNSTQIVLYGNDTEEAIADFLISHPDDYEITTENWYKSLESLIPSDESLVFASTMFKYCSISTKPDFGMKCFEIETDQNHYGILIDLDSDSEDVLSPSNAAWFYNENDNIPKASIQFNGTSLELVAYKNDDSILIYKADFKEKLNSSEIMNICVASFAEKDLFTPDRIMPYSEESHGEREFYLNIKSIGDFYYFETADKTIRFTTMRDALARGPIEVFDWLEQSDYNSLDKEYVLKLFINDLIESKKSEYQSNVILNACVKVKENYENLSPDMN